MHPTPKTSVNGAERISQLFWCQISRDTSDGVKNRLSDNLTESKSGPDTAPGVLAQQIIWREVTVNDAGLMCRRNGTT